MGVYLIHGRASRASQVERRRDLQRYRTNIHQKLLTQRRKSDVTAKNDPPDASRLSEDGQACRHMRIAQLRSKFPSVTAWEARQFSLEGGEIRNRSATQRHGHHSTDCGLRPKGCAEPGATFQTTRHPHPLPDNREDWLYHFSSSPSLSP
jgi:hypothetical protein